jgi:segregation and condensation protein B
LVVPDAPNPDILLESLLFVSAEPVELARLEQALGLGRDELESALARLSDGCQSRGVRVQRLDETVQLVSAPESATVIERFLGVQVKTRLSPAALETLAIIAYRQPVTRTQIELLRGVNCERALTTLLARGLVAETGRAETVGRPVLFGTTLEFLEYFGLASLSELPPLADN